MRLVNHHRPLLLLSALMFTPLLAWAQWGLQDFSGTQRDIDAYAGKGKWLIVMIWASDCHVCNAEAGAYVGFHERHKDNDATVLGISMDGEAKKDEARAFIERHHVTFPNLIGEAHAVAWMFTALTGLSWVGTPTFLIYSPSGELVAQQVGAAPVPLIEEFIQKHQTDSTPSASADAPN
jgi:peroxiredoxin